VLDAGCSYVITCTDIKTIKDLSEDYDALVLYLYRCLEQSEIKSILDTRVSTEDIHSSSRYEEIKSIPHRYYENLEVYNEVILNVGQKRYIYLQAAKILEMNDII